MLLILKIIKIFKKYYHNHDGWQYFLNILIIFNISNTDKEVTKELSEDDIIEDRNMLECFLKCFKWF